MLKVHTLTTCPDCDCKAYLPIGEGEDSQVCKVPALTFTQYVKVVAL